MRSIPLSLVATLTSGQRPAPDELDVREESSMPVVQHGRVFTSGPAPLNPYTIQLARYYKPILSESAPSGSEGGWTSAFAHDQLGSAPNWSWGLAVRPRGPTGLFIPGLNHRGFQARSEERR